MKIIVADCSLAGNGLNAKAFDIDCVPGIWLKADSALLTNGKPFFIPDFTNECSARVCVAVRMCRLGKCIAARFADRYFDALGVAIEFTAEDVLRKLRADGRPWEYAKSFDASVCMGKWVSVPADATKRNIEASFSVNNAVAGRVVIEDWRGVVCRLIESMSQVFTLRQGDMLLICQSSDGVVVNVNDHIEAWLGGERLTEFNVK